MVKTADARKSNDLGTRRRTKLHRSTIRRITDRSVDAIAVVVVDVLADNLAEARVACRNMAAPGGGCPHLRSELCKRLRLLAPFPAQPPKLGVARSNRARVTIFSHSYAIFSQPEMSLVPSGCRVVTGTGFGEVGEVVFFCRQSVRVDVECERSV